jgi:pyridoxal phosphate enzyme (YggS family)
MTNEAAARASAIRHSTFVICPMSIADNLHRVHERIARAAESAGRSADEIRLVGVTKYVGAKEAAELAAASCHNLGESRPQELWKKYDELKRAGVSPIWHLIGHLQRNKVARTLGCTNIIHSVDSERLIAQLNQACIDGHSMASGVDVLLEVNTSGEAAKHGLAPNEVESLLEAMSKYPRVFVLGLMTMAALEGGPAVAAGNFAALRELRDKLKKNNYSNTLLDELSMGMSADFEVAIKEGATIVRIGSLLWE